jgi:hypothetical protein
MADASAVKVVIGGQDVTRFGHVGRVRIDDVLNDAPNTAALTIILTPRVIQPETGPFAAHAFDHVGFNTAFNPAPIIYPPSISVGAPIGIYVSAGADQIFGGEITTREQYDVYQQARHVRLDLTCIDFTRRLNRRKVVWDYGQQSATAIVLDMMAKYAPTIATTAVEAGLPTITGGITFTFEEVSRALSRIAEKIGAYWYVDYAANLHFFTGTEAGAVPAPVVLGGRFSDLKITADLTQVRTRVIVEGDGGTALITLPAGDAITPISQTTPFNPAGGMAKIGPWRVTYTGIHAGGAAGGGKTNTVGIATGGSTGGTPPLPPTAPTPTVAGATTAGGLSGGPYSYAVTFELSDGSRSDLGAPGGPVTITGASNPAMTTAAFPTPPAKGPIAVGVEVSYATAFVAANGQTTAATTVVFPQLTGRPVADPTTGIGVGFVPGGAQAVGYYDYAVTFLTPAGETKPLFIRNMFLSSVGGTRVTFPTAFDGRVVGRRIYRSSVSAAVNVTTLPWRHVVDVPNNTLTQYDDMAADASLPTKNPPEFSTATDVGESAVVTVPTSADPRITKRRIYRKDGPGAYRFIAELPDNTGTVYNDVVVGPGGELAPTVNQITTGAVNLSNIQIGPAGTIRRRVFRTAAGGTQYRELVNLNNNTATTYLDTQSDANLGGSPLPPQGTPATAGTVPPTLIGSTTIQVTDLTGFPGAGWVVVESQMIRFSNWSLTGGQFLVGIPTSGPGAITASIPPGTVVTVSPALVGVSPLVPVTLGDAVQLIVQVDDLAAQAAIAAIEGGDGIIEHYIQDRRLSEAGARGRGLAELELFKTVETQLSYTTHDVNTRSGRTVHVDLPAPTSIAGDFLIQRVTIDDVSTASNTFPRRKVSASTTRFSFEDVLNRILLEQH